MLLNVYVAIVLYENMHIIIYMITVDMPRCRARQPLNVELTHGKKHKSKSMFDWCGQKLWRKHIYLLASTMSVEYAHKGPSKKRLHPPNILYMSKWLIDWENWCRENNQEYKHRSTKVIAPCNNDYCPVCLESLRFVQPCASIKLAWYITRCFSFKANTELHVHRPSPSLTRGLRRTDTDITTLW